MEGPPRNAATTTSTVQVGVVLRQPMTYDGGGHAGVGRSMRSECAGGKSGKNIFMVASLKVAIINWASNIT